MNGRMQAALFALPICPGETWAYYAVLPAKCQLRSAGDRWQYGGSSRDAGASCRARAIHPPLENETCVRRLEFLAVASCVRS